MCAGAHVCVCVSRGVISISLTREVLGKVLGGGGGIKHISRTNTEPQLCSADFLSACNTRANAAEIANEDMTNFHPPTCRRESYS